MEQDSLGRLVHEALERLHSRSFLATSPLTDALSSEDQRLSADDLRRRLLDAIDQLKPIVSTPSHAADWRRHRHLVLRYVEGLSLEQIAHALDISVRQASRDHQQAVASLVSILEAQRHAEGRDKPAVRQAPSAGPSEEHPTSDLSEEAAKLAESEEGGADLSEIIEGVLPIVSRLAAERSVSFSVSVNNTLPPVAVSPTLLRQAILNVLVYACETSPGSRFSLKGSDTAQGITLRILRREDESEAGLPAPPTPSSDFQHILDTASQLLIGQGGSIEHDGPAISGSTYLRLVFPPVPLHNILVVDDNPDLASLFRRFLRNEPYRIIQATSGARAIQIARDLQPEIVILDVMLPHQDGWDILRLFQSDPDIGETPIVVCSVLPEQTLARSLGVADFLAKPVTQPALLAILERWCSAHPRSPDRLSPNA